MTEPTPSPAPPAAGTHLRVVGDRWSPGTHDVKDFLARGRVPYRWHDPAVSEVARHLLGGVAPEDREKHPIVLFADGSYLAAPTREALAARLGLQTEAAAPFYDLVIVGGGPAGMAAAVYGASEGVRTVIVEREAAGGQAAQSARIENYLGFPDGLSGAEFTERAARQAAKFGVEIVVSRRATSLRADPHYLTVGLDDGSELCAHAVLVSTGLAWRKIDAPGCGDLLGSGIYYGAAAAEAAAVRGRDVYMLGAGNSAAQAALLLARFAKSVTMVALEEDFSEKMSSYLYERIAATPNIHSRPCCTLAAAEGNGRLERLRLRHVHSGEEDVVACEALFVFIGAAPETAWLGDAVLRDEKGFVLTGRRVRDRWPLKDREPFAMETSCPGVFAAGDVRAGAVPRVGAAVGDGSVAIQNVHEHLAER